MSPTRRDQPVTGDELANGHNRHGSRVLSVVGGYDPGNFIGVAPEAEFLLAKTEDDTQERPIEEDLWVAGLEWADSLGAQVVNSSIGYNQWDDGSGYTVDDLDGQTALTTIAAQTAISRGITIVAAAGNEANTPWKYVTVPADGADVISVGAIDLARRNIAVFSSHGPTADGRIKPDVVAPGVAVVVASGRSAESERDTYALSDYIRISGTSFAAPFVAGISALLIEIHPTWGPREIADALRQSTTDLGDAGPDTLYGWGLVDAAAASGLPLETPGQTIATAPFPNPAVLGGSEGLNSVFFPLQLATREDVGVSIFDLSGTLIAQPVQQRLEAGDYSRDRALRWEVPDRIDSGIYLYRLESETLTRTGRIAIVRDGR